MNTKHANSHFTLVELLVVISIIALLASMLLPVLSRARESAKRTMCMNNLKQNYLAFVMYHGDNDARLPCGIVKAPTPLDTTYATNSDQAGNRGGVRNGWQYVIDERYVDKALLACPSQDFAPQFSALTWGVHYSFRYNSTRAVDYGDKIGHDAEACEVFLSKDNLSNGTPENNLLLSDATNGRFDNNATVIYFQSVRFNEKRWPHQVGGNVATKDGSITFVRNRYGTITKVWPNTRFYILDGTIN